MSFRCGLIRYVMDLLSILKSRFKSEIGRQFVINSESPFLYIRVTRAVLVEGGSADFLYELFNTSVTSLPMISQNLI